MEGFIKDIGKMENNMVKENFINLLIKNGKKEFGIMEKEYNGLVQVVKRKGLLKLVKEMKKMEIRIRLINSFFYCFCFLNNFGFFGKEKINMWILY
jgi:hypothetical protein